MSNSFTPTIFLDMDGVVADFVAGICAAHGIDRARIPDGQWDFIASLEMTEDRFYAPCRKAEFWEELPEVPKSRQFVETLRTLAPVVLCSQPTKHPGAFAGKYAWARKVFGPGLPVCLVEPDKTILARPGAFLIDDNDNWVRRWDEAGGVALLYPTRYNSGAEWRRAVNPLEHDVHTEVLKRLRSALLWHYQHVEAAGGYDADRPKWDTWR